MVETWKVYSHFWDKVNYNTWRPLDITCLICASLRHTVNPKSSLLLYTHLYSGLGSYSVM